MEEGRAGARDKNCSENGIRFPAGPGGSRCKVRVRLVQRRVGPHADVRPRDTAFV